MRKVMENLLKLLVSPLVILVILIIGAGLACWTFLNIVFAIFLTVQYMFLFQYFVLGKCSFREAARKSRELIKGHRNVCNCDLWSIADIIYHNMY